MCRSFDVLKWLPALVTDQRRWSRHIIRKERGTSELISECHEVSVDVSIYLYSEEWLK